MKRALKDLFTTNFNKAVVGPRGFSGLIRPAGAAALARGHRYPATPPIEPDR